MEDWGVFPSEITWDHLPCMGLQHVCDAHSMFQSVLTHVPLTFLYLRSGKDWAYIGNILRAVDCRYVNNLALPYYLSFPKISSKFPLVQLKLISSRAIHG